MIWKAYTFGDSKASFMPIDEMDTKKGLKGFTKPAC